MRTDSECLSQGVVLGSFLPTPCFFFSSLQKLFVSHPLWGTGSGDGADAPRRRGSECESGECGTVGGCKSRRRVSLATCLCWLHLPSRGFLSLVSSVQPISLPSTGELLRAPVVMCHQMTQVAKTPLPENPISINLAGGNVDMDKFEPFHF